MVLLTPRSPAATEKYEVATVTAVGKPGTQAYLAADATAGATNIQVTSAADISAGDKIRLDIDSVGHGIETVTVTRVGTAATHTNLAANAARARPASRSAACNGPHGGRQDHDWHAGEAGNGDDRQPSGRRARAAPGIEIAPALTREHIKTEKVWMHGTGVDLAAPLRFNHAENFPFSDRGTGISFQPPTAFAHIQR